MPSAESRLAAPRYAVRRKCRKSQFMKYLRQVVSIAAIALPFAGCMPRDGGLVDRPGSSMLPSQTQSDSALSSINSTGTSTRVDAFAGGGAPQLASAANTATEIRSGRPRLPSEQFTPPAVPMQSIATRLPDANTETAVDPSALRSPSLPASEVDTLAAAPNSGPPSRSFIPPPPLPSPFADSLVTAPPPAAPVATIAPPPEVPVALPPTDETNPSSELVSWPVTDRLPATEEEKPIEPVTTIRIRPVAPTIVEVRPTPPTRGAIERLPQPVAELPPVKVSSGDEIVRLPQPVVPAAAVESEQPRVLNAFRPPQGDDRSSRRASVITPEVVEAVDAPVIFARPKRLPAIVHVTTDAEPFPSRSQAEVAQLASMTPSVRSVLVRPQSSITAEPQVSSRRNASQASAVAPVAATATPRPAAPSAEQPVATASRSVSVLASRNKPIAPPPAVEQRTIVMHREAPADHGMVDNRMASNHRANTSPSAPLLAPPIQQEALPEPVEQEYLEEEYVQEQPPSEGMQEELLPPPPTTTQPRAMPRVTAQPTPEAGADSPDELLAPSGEPGLLDPDQMTDAEPPQRFKSISSLGTNIATPTFRTITGDALPMPADYATEFFANQGPDLRSARASMYGDYVPVPQGLEFCYQPLYYEEVNAERYGLTFGLAQPVVSAAQFYGRTAVIPFMLVTQPPRKCTCHAHWTLPGYRSGWEVPHYSPRPDAAAVEAAFVLGLILLIP